MYENTSPISITFLTGLVILAIGDGVIAKGTPMTNCGAEISKTDEPILSVPSSQCSKVSSPKTEVILGRAGSAGALVLLASP